MSVTEADAAGHAGPAEGGARASWTSRASFVLAAAGSAVGLGSIWKFPYITGTHGGGWFVLVYLACIVAVALPIMIAEILIGREARRSPVGAFRALARGDSRWTAVGWLGLVAAFLILSYYFVVSGWTAHYAWLAATGALFERGTSDYAGLFSAVHADPAANLAWFFAFVALTAAVVAAGVQQGIERCCRALVPLLLLVMAGMAVEAARGPGFARAVDFVFGVGGRISGEGVLEALGHSFFTLSLGMGAMITYGSYLGRREDAVAAGALVAGFDTVVSLLACLAIFPIVFAFGLAVDAGPGLVFVSLPGGFERMAGGAWIAPMFFGLLAVAALSSTISLFEVLVSHLVDEHRLTRARASVASALALAVAGIPSALAGSVPWFGSGVERATAWAFGGQGRDWFGTVDYLSSNWLLPMSGLGIAGFMAWRVGDRARERAFRAGSRAGRLYWTWVRLLRYVVPPAVIVVFLRAIGLI